MNEYFKLSIKKSRHLLPLLDTTELEHIYLVNHFLLLTTEKLAKTKYEGKLEHKWEVYQKIMLDTEFKWNMPEHMIPSGVEDNWLEKILVQLVRVEELIQDENYTSKTQSISVYELGKTDYIGYCYFLLSHLERHLNNYLRRT